MRQTARCIMSDGSDSIVGKLIVSYTRVICTMRALILLVLGSCSPTKVARIYTCSIPAAMCCILFVGRAWPMYSLTNAPMRVVRSPTAVHVSISGRELAERPFDAFIHTASDSRFKKLCGLTKRGDGGRGGNNPRRIRGLGGWAAIGIGVGGLQRFAVMKTRADTALAYGWRTNATIFLRPQNIAAWFARYAAGYRRKERAGGNRCRVSIAAVPGDGLRTGGVSA